MTLVRPSRRKDLVLILCSSSLFYNYYIAGGCMYKKSLIRIFLLLLVWCGGAHAADNPDGFYRPDSPGFGISEIAFAYAVRCSRQAAVDAAAARDKESPDLEWAKYVLSSSEEYDIYDLQDAIAAVVNSQEVDRVKVEAEKVALGEHAYKILAEDFNNSPQVFLTNCLFYFIAEAVRSEAEIKECALKMSLGDDSSALLSRIKSCEQKQEKALCVLDDLKEGFEKRKCALYLPTAESHGGLEVVQQVDQGFVEARPLEEEDGDCYGGVEETKDSW